MGTAVPDISENRLKNSGPIAPESEHSFQDQRHA
jgi:hypothetical protein